MVNYQRSKVDNQHREFEWSLISILIASKIIAVMIITVNITNDNNDDHHNAQYQQKMSASLDWWWCQLSSDARGWTAAHWRAGDDARAAGENQKFLFLANQNFWVFFGGNWVRGWLGVQVSLPPHCNRPMCRYPPLQAAQAEAMMPVEDISDDSPMVDARIDIKVVRAAEGMEARF